MVRAPPRSTPRWSVAASDWYKGQLGRMGTGPELYNLADDIGEKTNLAGKNPEKVKELQADLEKWESKLAQPLWKRQTQPKAARRTKAAANRAKRAAPAPAK